MGRRHARLGRQYGWTVAYLLPSVGLLTTFVLVPIGLTIWLSFHNWSTQTPFGSARFIGLANYRQLLADGPVGRDFRQALRNTFTYAG